VLEPFVDADDIADVAAAADRTRTRGELYELTGPRLLTFADAVAAIGRDRARPHLRVCPDGRLCRAAWSSSRCPTTTCSSLRTC
jgi:nucleoside-diphosphate-sugar epimerase